MDAKEDLIGVSSSSSSSLLLLKSRLQALTRVLKTEVEDDTRFEKLLDALTSYIEEIRTLGGGDGGGERKEGEVKKRLEFLLSGGFLESLKQGLEHEDLRIRSISLRLLGRFAASHRTSFGVLLLEEGSLKLLDRLLVESLKDEEMEEEALLRSSSLIGLTSLLSSSWGLDWLFSSSQRDSFFFDRLLSRAFKAFDDPSKFVSNASVELLSTLLNGSCRSSSRCLDSSQEIFFERVSKLLEHHLTSSSVSSDSKQHSLSLLMALCRSVFKAQEQGEWERRRLLLHFLSLRSIIPRSFLLVRDNDRFVRSNAVELISIATRSRCYSLFLASSDSTGEEKTLGEAETSKFIRDEVVRWLLLREGNQRNILTALSVVACSSFLHTNTVRWKRRLFCHLSILSLSVWFPSQPLPSSELLEKEGLLCHTQGDYSYEEENQLLSIVNVAFFSKMKIGLLHSLLEIAHTFVSVDQLPLPQFWIGSLINFLQIVDLRDDVRFQRSAVSLLKKCVHQSTPPPSSSSASLTDHLLTSSSTPTLAVIQDIITSTTDASLVLDLFHLLYEILRCQVRQHNSLSLPSSSCDLKSYLCDLIDQLLENLDWEVRDSAIEFLAMFFQHELLSSNTLLLLAAKSWGFVERLLRYGKTDSDSGVKTSVLSAFLQLASNQLAWTIIMEDKTVETDSNGMCVETEETKQRKWREALFDFITDSLSENEELVRRAALDVILELLKNEWGVKFLLESRTSNTFKTSFQHLFQDEDWEVKLRAVQTLLSASGLLFSPDRTEDSVEFHTAHLALQFFLYVEGDRLLIDTLMDEDRVPRLEARKGTKRLLEWCSSKEFTEEEEKEIEMDTARRMKVMVEKLKGMGLERLIQEATAEALYGLDDQFILDENLTSVDESNNQMDCY